MPATLLTQNNIIAGLSQILPNYVELRANALKNKDKIGEAISIMKDYRLLDSEDVIYFGAGQGLNLNENRFTQITGDLTKSMVKNVGEKVFRMDTAKAERAGDLLDAFMSNILGFNDFPLEQYRKYMAIMNAMQKMGIPNKQALDKFIEEGGPRMRDAFESHVRTEFTNTGGGVVSSGSMRGTIFDHIDEYYGDHL